MVEVETKSDGQQVRENQQIWIFQNRLDGGYYQAIDWWYLMVIFLKYGQHVKAMSKSSKHMLKHVKTC